MVRRIFAAGKRLSRAVRRHLGPPKVLLVYHPEYQAPPNVFADPLRAQKIVGHLTAQGLVAARHVHTPPAPIAPAALARVHGYDYLESLERTEALRRIFPVEAAPADLQAVLRQQRWMTAGTVLAARLATKGGPPVVNLGGGFHHAHRDRGEGYCIFNDVAVAIHDQRARGLHGRVLVVDLDLHPGNGTRTIFAGDPTVFTLSIHARSWDDEGEAVADRSVELGPAIGDRTYRETLAAHLPAAFNEVRPDLVFYVAGVDVAADDALGSWRVSADTLLWRDRLVVALAGRAPLVWTLAGGYGPDAWRYTARSLAWLADGDDAPIPSEAERALAHFRRIKDRFAPAELTSQPDDPFRLTAADVLGDLTGARGPSRVLGYYSAYGVEVALERYGVLDCVRRAGVERPKVEVDLDHPRGHLIRVRSDDARGDVFIEVVLRESRAVTAFRLLSIEWLLLQNPRAGRAPDRPLLPGQEHPGLGCLRPVVMMLVMACERLGLDGLLFTPSHFHVAAMARGLLRFLDPHVEARFLALEQALEGVPLVEATRCVHAGRIVDEATGRPVGWPAAEMVLPVSPELAARLDAPDYDRTVEATARSLRLRRVA